MHRSLLIALATGFVPPPTSPAGEPGPFVSALWLVQRHGTASALNPKNDEHVKALLAKGLKDSVLTAAETEGLMEPATFSRLAGPDSRLDAAKIAQALAADAPPSRAHLLPAVRSHAEFLTTTFDMIDPVHREAGEKFADWLAKNYKPGRPLHVTVVCTGNSRRSILGATMGNIAASYHGMPEVRFHSGGTAPTAFNPRTVAALAAIGVEVQPTGKQAARGEPKTENPVYRVRWGASDEFEVLEFSKVYSDPANPESGFAALMVCSEADAACPLVKGAAARIAVPYLDPKIYDGSPFESAKYAERRDDIGRLMLSAFGQARSRVSVPNR
jgi:arsenate reductase (thioredoxin)